MYVRVRAARGMSVKASEEVERQVGLMSAMEIPGGLTAGFEMNLVVVSRLLSQYALHQRRWHAVRHRHEP